MAVPVERPGKRIVGMRHFRILRRIGENAGERIYLSWENSVALARKQYRSVLERWESGELRRKRAQFDGFFELAGDVTGALERAREVFDKYF